MAENLRYFVINNIPYIYTMFYWHIKPFKWRLLPLWWDVHILIVFQVFPVQFSFKFDSKKLELWGTFISFELKKPARNRVSGCGDIKFVRSRGDACDHVSKT